MKFYFLVLLVLGAFRIIRKYYHFTEEYISERGSSLREEKKVDLVKAKQNRISVFCDIIFLGNIKMLAPLSRISNKLGRNLMTNIVRNHSHGGIPGENLPFGITNRYKLTAYFILYFGSGLSAPYLICRHQLLKK